MNYKISGYCDNCEEFGSVYYDYLLEKYWCQSCLKVDSYDFSIMEIKK